MKKMRAKNFLFLVITIFMVIAFATSLADVPYQIKKGDTLSKILNDHDLIPLYGKKGFIKLTIKLNKMRHAGNLIRVGQIIQLPILPINEEVKRKVAAVEEKIIIISSDGFPYSRFVYSPHLSFLKVDSTNNVNFGGSSITALSKSGFGLDLSWDVFYNERFSFFGFGSLEHFSFYSVSDYSFNKSSATLLNFGVGGNFHFSPDLVLTSKIALREISFLDIKTPTSINLDSISVLEIELGLKKTLFTKKQLTGVWGVHASGFLPSSSSGSYKSKLGYGAGSNFELTHKDRGLFLSYDLRSLSISEIKNKEHSIVLGINLFGENTL